MYVFSTQAEHSQRASFDSTVLIHGPPGGLNHVISQILPDMPLLPLHSPSQMPLPSSSPNLASAPTAASSGARGSQLGWHLRIQQQGFPRPQGPSFHPPRGAAAASVTRLLAPIPWCCVWVISLRNKQHLCQRKYK